MGWTSSYSLTPADVARARDALMSALAKQGVVLASPDMIYWLLGQVSGENNFGTSPDWTIPDPDGLNTAQTNPDAPSGPSHNWGAVRASSSAPNFIWHKDQDANGVVHVYGFARPGSPEAGAALFLKALLRTDLGPAVSNVFADTRSTPHDMARAMFTRDPDPSVTKPSTQAYYTGNQKKYTNEQIVNQYAAMIANGANKVRAAAGLSGKVVPGGSLPQPPPAVIKPPSQPATSSNWWLAIPIVGAIYGAYRVLRR
jgi:hypothetical protein